MRRLRYVSISLLFRLPKLNEYTFVRGYEQSFAIDQKMGIGEASARKPLFFVRQREDCEGSSFAEQEVSIITSTSNIFLNMYIFRKEFLLYPPLKKKMQIIKRRLFFSLFISCYLTLFCVFQTYMYLN